MRKTRTIKATLKSKPARNAAAKRAENAKRGSHLRGSVAIALLGTKFMGRAHSIAWANAPKFFDLPLQIEMAWVAGRAAADTHEFGRRWGWRGSTIDWREAIANPAVQLVDIATPNHVHREMALAALAAGRHVACEKPLAGTLKDAREMRDAARRAAKMGVHTFVWFNYRRAPAIALAHTLVQQGRIGRIFHIRAAYLQDWGGAATPLAWRFQSELAGSGAHGDLNAHCIDLARFISGEEVAEVVGAVEETFIKERMRVAGDGAAISGKGASKRRARMGRSTVDDCVLFLARMSGGAVASFESTRLATGNKNRNCIEINGELGSIRFNFERMNELEFWDNTLAEARRGWTSILCTEASHPYVKNYWPAGHLIGYEHGFVSQAADIVGVLGGGSAEVAIPDFEDAWKTQCVLEAAIQSARRRGPVAVAEIE
ncbi:MAG: Gfo/Idh/MocA family oxidoreductase [Phycisphaerales bacterium]|nr:Gfo/Idh/MocA family oxidoreductase [Phycisphaerales bacterium]